MPLVAAAQIRIDQASNAVPFGTAGIARDDIYRAVAVVLRNGDPVGVKSSRWTLLSKPYGSSATITNPTSAVASIVPDTYGTYRIRLEINAGGVGEYDIRTFKVRDPAGMALPAGSERADEDNYAISPGVYNADGWTREMNERQLRSLDTRGTPISQFVLGGDEATVAVTWGLPMGILQSLEVRSDASTDSSISIYADAALTKLLHSWSHLDTTGAGWRMFEPKTLSGLLGVGLQDGKFYVRIINDDADATYLLYLRVKAP